ncbi:MAG: hypothetical protein Q4D98_01100 [Planctomycetia bacterium]|nr:hypothetical protein [Planctomycetia bacterium]
MKWTHFWPGFTAFYYGGSLGGLAASLFYAWFACGVVACTLFWSEVIPRASQGTLLLIFVITWVLGILITGQNEAARRLAEEKRRKTAMAEDSLPLAQTAYLRQDFYEAERMLWSRLEKVPEDVPSRLLLVSVLRREKREEDAQRQLAILEANPEIGPWLFEVHREKQKKTSIN